MQFHHSSARSGGFHSLPLLSLSDSLCLCWMLETPAGLLKSHGICIQWGNCKHIPPSAFNSCFFFSVFSLTNTNVVLEAWIIIGHIFKIYLFILCTVRKHLYLCLCISTLSIPLTVLCFFWMVNGLHFYSAFIQSALQYCHNIETHAHIHTPTTESTMLGDSQIVGAS